MGIPLPQAAIIYIQVHAAGFVGKRVFLEQAAQIGMGLIAPPIQAGITADQQQAPKIMATPPGGNPQALPATPDQTAGGLAATDGAEAPGNNFQQSQLDPSSLAM